jgi:hypothetical protein
MNKRRKFKKRTHKGYIPPLPRKREEQSEPWVYTPTWDVTAPCTGCHQPLGNKYSPVTTGIEKGGLWYHYECCLKALSNPE